MAQSLSKAISSAVIVGAAAFWAGTGSAGDLMVEHSGEKKIFTIEQLESDFEQRSFSTTTNWTSDRNVKFSGPLMVDVLCAAGVAMAICPGGKQIELIEAVAEDDYAVEIDLAAVIDKLDPIIATTMDGAPVDGGFAPLWIVFNRDGNNEVMEQHQGYWIWSLKSLVELEE